MCCSCMHHLLPWVASYSICHASCLVVHHVMFMCGVFTMLFASFRLCFFSIVLILLRSWGFVRLSLVHLRPFVFFMDSFFFLAGFQARWPYPRNHYYLCYASLHALLPCQCYDAYHLFIKPPKLPCQPLTFFTLPSKPLFGYVTALLSPSYSVASCRWRLKAVPCWNIYLLVGISLYCRVILMHQYTW